MSDVRDAGRELRRLREERHLTQRDVERLTDGRVLAQQVSRLETGALSKPPMEDLVILGGLYGLSPTQVAELYGYGARPAQPESLSELQRRMADEEALERALAEAPSVSEIEQRRATRLEGTRVREQVLEPREHGVSESRIESRQPHAEQPEAEQTAALEEQPAGENPRTAVHALVDIANDLPAPLRQKLDHWAELILHIMFDEASKFYDEMSSTQ